MANSVTPEGYKDTILGVVPQEWNIRCLGDLLSRCTNGLTYNVSISNGIPVTRIETISTGEINYAKVGHIQNSVGYEDFRMQKGDILYSHINSLSQIGKVAYYNGKKEKTFEDILDFHVRFERIHPFQDGNGRVGRLILFKECLKYNIVPFIIDDQLKMFYYRGLKEWDYERGYLMDTCLLAQDKYKAYLDYFRIAYENNKSN